MSLSPRQRSLLVNLALATASVVAVLGLLEAAARLFYDEPWHEKLVGVQRRGERYPYRLNSRGLRSPEYSAVKQPGERRVLVLGDSFTFGQGVFDGEKIFPRILERRLNEKAEKPSSRVTVLNGGLPASLTGDWLRLWHALAADFDPDVVLIVFFLRDGTRIASIPEFFGEIRQAVTLRNQGSLIYEKSYLYRTLRDRLDRAAISERYGRAFLDAYFGDEEQTAEWRAAQGNLLRLKELAERSGAAVGFVIFPVLVGLDDDYPFAAICDLLERFGRDHGLPVLNLLPAFLGEDGPELWISSYDQHPNEKGHAIAAEAMLPFLQELLAAP